MHFLLESDLPNFQFSRPVVARCCFLILLLFVVDIYFLVENSLLFWGYSCGILEVSSER